MQSLARDIKFTLSIKFLLLFILWLVCFKGIGKPSMDVKQWILGPHVKTEKSATN